MAKGQGNSKMKSVIKHTSQANCTNVKTSTMNKSQKNSFKRYRGQGK
jgi:hypothetical protein